MLLMQCAPVLRHGRVTYGGSASSHVAVAGYIGLVLFGSSLPGKPAYAVEWRTLVETWNCSINFFYVNQIFNWLGIRFIVQSPVSALASAWLRTD